MSKRRREPKAAERPVHPPSLKVAFGLAAGALVIGGIAAAVQPWNSRIEALRSRTPPDESAHLLYIEDLLETHRLPILTSGSGNFEAHQPPLYYASAVPAALVGRWLTGGGTPGLLSSTEVLCVRAWSVLIFAGVVAVCYLLACEVFPRSPWLAAGAAGVALLLPGHVINVVAVTNDGLAELFCCLTLWLGVRTLRDGERGLGRHAAMGALIGAGLLTKSSCLFLLPVAVVVTGMGSMPAEGEKPAWRDGIMRVVVVVEIAVALWAPWIAHNLSHYPGDPLVTRTFKEIFSKDRLSPDPFLFTIGPLGYMRVLTVWTWASFWGVFGQASVFMPDWYYIVAAGATIAPIAGFVRGRRRWAALDIADKRVWSILALAAILVLLQFLRFSTDFFQAQARYLFPAIGPIGCLMIAGVVLLGRSGEGETAARWERRAVLGGLLVIGCLLVFSLVEAASDGAARGQPLWVVDWDKIQRLLGIK